MPQRFHYLIDTTDFLGRHPKFEVTVIAADEEEARDELEAWIAMREEVDSWHVADTIEIAPVSETDVFARDYREKGAHCYISRV